jgi:glycosyltransferase involved in cell wall biosynthesis
MAMRNTRTRRLRVAHVSTFQPLKCGIAFFASDLMNAAPVATQRKYALHYGGVTVADATGAANVSIASEVVALAKSIAASDCDVVVLQHEFGIWGGRFGEHLLPFLDNLSKPIISILHTTFPPGARPDVQVHLLERLVRQSVRVVMLTADSRRTAEGLLGGRVEHAVVIPHGVPRFPYNAPPATGRRGQGIKLVTPGFFRPDKGFEIVLKAVGRLRRRGHDVRYLIAGQPQEQFSGQETYRQQVEQLVAELDLSGAVTLDTRFLSVEEQVAAIQAAHVGVFAYQEPAQSSSGTLPLVLSTGRPAVCTPFEYAKAKHQECRATALAEGFSAENVSDAIERLIEEDRWDALAEDAFAVSAPWAWTAVGRRYLREFEAAAAVSVLHGITALATDAAAGFRATHDMDL